MRRILKFIGLGFLSISLLAIIGLVGLGMSVNLAGEESTPSGLKQNSAQYLIMRDGTNIAVDIWLPPNLTSSQTVPTLIVGTRYGRAYHLKFAGKILIGLGKVHKNFNLPRAVQILNEEGYAVILVDARGSGASYGEREYSWSNNEVADYGEIADWIIQQSWSNQRIGAYGVSYNGVTAEMISVAGHPAILAVAPQYSYFDLFQELGRPGGVYDEWFMSRWSDITDRMDQNTTCLSSGFKCWLQNFVVDGVKPVDGPGGLRLRDSAYKSRSNPTVVESLKGTRFRDDEYGDTGLALDAASPFQFATKIETSGVAINAWVGWYDSANVDGAIARFNTLSNRQLVVIGPYSHGGFHDTNPYAEVAAPVAPDHVAQTRQLAQFFDPILKDGQSPALSEHLIRYFVLGEDVWKTTRQWPPENIQNVRWWLGAENKIENTAPIGPQSSDNYAVNFDVRSGTHPRWHSIHGPDIVYDQRAERDKLLLTYTSEPLDQDMEITGSAEITLHLSTTHEDGAVHVYLEDVAPNGTVTYLTEGILRLSDRHVSEDPPYTVPGTYHSIKRDVSQPMIPGKVEKIIIPLYNIAALVEKNHRIRIAIAGADSSTFERVPEKGQPTITIHRDELKPSYFDLPMRWR